MMLSQARLTLYLPLTFFALPLALSNNLSQPLALLLLLPFVVYAARGFTRALPLLALVIASSVLQVLVSSGANISLYQFLRSGIPFSILCCCWPGTAMCWPMWKKSRWPIASTTGASSNASSTSSPLASCCRSACMAWAST